MEKILPSDKSLIYIVIPRTDERNSHRLDSSSDQRERDYENAFFILQISHNAPVSHIYV